MNLHPVWTICIVAMQIFGTLENTAALGQVLRSEPWVLA